MKYIVHEYKKVKNIGFLPSVSFDILERAENYRDTNIRLESAIHNFTPSQEKQYKNTYAPIIEESISGEFKACFCNV